MTEPRDVSFDDLYAYRTWVRALARRLVRDDATADDVEQQVWATAFERPPREGGSARAWLGTVARNIARNLRRAAGRRDAHESAARRPEGDDAGDPGRLVAEAEAQQELVRAVLALDEPYRTTVLLRHFRGLDVAAIADAQGVPAETVRTRLRRAHERLRDALDRRFGGGRAWAVLLVGDAGMWRTAARGGSVATGAKAGGALMAGTLAKSIAAAAVVVAGVALWWGLHESRDERGAAPAAAAVVPEDAASSAPRSRPARASAPSVADVTVPPGADAAIPEPVDLDRVDRDLDLHGTVVDPDGRPVAGARIETATFPWREGGAISPGRWREADAGPATRSARDGSFALRLARAARVELSVSAPGFGTSRFDRRLAGERVRIVLHPAVALTVVANDESGTPLPGIPVRVFTTGGAPDPTVHEDLVTDAQGTAVFPSLPPSITVHVDANSPVADMGWIPVELPATGAATKEIVFRGGHTIRGRVTDAATSAPVAGARVGMNWVLDLPVTTAADGTYELPGWTGAGVLDVHVVAPGYARSSANVGDRETIDFALLRGHAISGRVVGPDGAPVAGALVAAKGESFGRGGDRLSIADTRSDGDGTFVLDGLSRELSHAVIVTSPAGSSRVVAVPPQRDGDVALGDVRLGAPLRLEGTVTQSDGTPVARASVALGPVRESASRRAMDTVTDDLGRFRFHGVESGEFDLRIAARGQPEVHQRVVLRNADVLDVAVVLESLREVRVRIVREDGSPVAGVPVRATDERRRASGATSDRDGVAVVRASGRIDVEVVAWAMRRRDPSILAAPPARVEADASDVTITMKSGDVWTGTITGPDARPVVGALVSFHSGGRDLEFCCADGSGRFQITVPRGTRGELRFLGDVQDGNSTRSVALAGSAAADSEPREVAIRAESIRTGLAVRVVVLDAAGRACPGAMVFLSRATMSGAPAIVRCDSEGRGEFRDLDARPAQITVPATARGVLAAPVAVVPDGQELVLRLEPATVVSGVVTAADGSPVSVQVMISRGDDILASNRSAASDGRFTFHVAAGDGPFRIVARRDDDATAEADGVAAGATDVSLVFSK